MVEEHGKKNGYFKKVVDLVLSKAFWTAIALILLIVMQGADIVKDDNKVRQDTARGVQAFIVQSVIKDLQTNGYTVLTVGNQSVALAPVQPRQEQKQEQSNKTKS